MSTVLYPYQSKDVRHIERLNGRCLLASEMGTGKTVISLKWAEWCLDNGPVLVICPATLKINWQREAATHCNIRAEILGGEIPPPWDLPPAPIYIINYNVLWRGKKTLEANSWVNVLIQLKPRLVICDEVHYLKTRSTKRSKAVRLICKDVPHLIMIGGTPLTNRPAELYNVANMLWPQEFRSFTDFAFRYCDPKQTPWGMDVRGAKNLPELHSKLKKLGMIRRLKRDVLKYLPEKTRHIIPVELHNRKEYDQAEQNFIAWLRAVSPRKAMSALKMQYMAKRGYLYRLAGQLKAPHSQEWISNFLESSEGKLIAFGVHYKVLEPLHEKWQTQSVIVNGKVIGRKRQIAIDQFTHDPRKRIFFGNVQAAGVGWNGTAASDVLFVEFGYTPAEMMQAEDRAHRIGTKSAVTCHYLVAKDTVEEDFCRMLERKQKILSGVLDGGEGEELALATDLDKAIAERQRMKL